MAIPDLGVTPYGPDGRAKIKLETYERTRPDGSRVTIHLSPRNPDECWFCNTRPPTHAFTGGSVVMNLKDTFLGWSLGNPDVPAEVFAPGDWPTCTPCHDLIQADRWSRLHVRVLELTARQPGKEGATARAALRKKSARVVPDEWLAIRRALSGPARTLP
jgi:hypothetical protein